MSWNRESEDERDPRGARSRASRQASSGMEGELRSRGAQAAPERRRQASSSSRPRVSGSVSAATIITP
ncbi:hypothetical protein WJ74_19015 [Burkholderia ubonensis]|nr:hypothetical protein WJ74_19015 [Burkholderia ubonensis]